MSATDLGDADMEETIACPLGVFISLHELHTLSPLSKIGDIYWLTLMYIKINCRLMPSCSQGFCLGKDLECVLLPRPQQASC